MSGFTLRNFGAAARCLNLFIYTYLYYIIGSFSFSARPPNMAEVQTFELSSTQHKTLLDWRICKKKSSNMLQKIELKVFNRPIIHLTYK